jgi:hypothetical protein
MDRVVLGNMVADSAVYEFPILRLVPAKGSRTVHAAVAHPFSNPVLRYVRNGGDPLGARQSRKTVTSRRFITDRAMSSALAIWYLLAAALAAKWNSEHS